VFEVEVKAGGGLDDRGRGMEGSVEDGGFVGLGRGRGRGTGIENDLAAVEDWDWGRHYCGGRAEKNI